MRRVLHPHLKSWVCAVSVVLFLVFPLCKVQATQTYQFDVFTKETPYWSSLNMDMVVSDAGLGKVDFTFHNTSSVDSSIARIYFDDGSLLSIATTTNDPRKTNFSETYPGPNNLPGGNLLTPAFVAVKAFDIGAVQPPPKNGVNPPDEWVTIRFDLKTGGSYQSVINELGDGDLRVGIHIIGLPSGSESAVNVLETVVNVPEPATLFLLAIGAAATIRRRGR